MVKHGVAEKHSRSLSLRWKLVRMMTGADILIAQRSALNVMATSISETMKQFKSETLRFLSSSVVSQSFVGRIANVTVPFN